MLRTANPAFNARSFGGFVGARAASVASGRSDVMTVQGTVNRTALLLGILFVCAAYPWYRAINDGIGAATPFVWVGFIGGIAASLATIFRPTWAPISAPVYAAFEGLALGAISAVYQVRYPGIVLQAVALTAMTLFALLLAYKTRLIRATENFKLGVVAATGGIAMLYLVNIVIRMFGGGGIGFIHESGTYGIAFSVFVVAIAALNLVLDFDFIEQGAEHGAPKYMEWYGAFGLVVTLVWLYLELLRLIAKLQSRD